MIPPFLDERELNKRALINYQSLENLNKSSEMTISFLLYIFRFLSEKPAELFIQMKTAKQIGVSVGDPRYKFYLDSDIAFSRMPSYLSETLLGQRVAGITFVNNIHRCLVVTVQP